MTAITITDLENAKLDVDHIAAIATSPSLTATDRLGNTKDTIAGVLNKFEDSGVMAYATLVALQAVTDKPINSVGWVTDDPSEINNAYYRWTGSLWVITGVQPVDSSELEAVEASISAELDGIELELAVVDNKIPLPALDLPWAVTDSEGNALICVKQDGFAKIVTDELPGSDMLGDYAWAITDKDKYVLIGVKYDGTVTVNNAASNTEVNSVFTSGPLDAQDIFILIENEVYQITSEGHNFSPTYASDIISYMTRNGSVAGNTASTPEIGSVADFVEVIYHLLSSGQSLSMGTSSAVTTVQAPAANRLFTIQDGVRLTSQDTTLTEEMVVPFKALVAKTTETPAVQLSAQLNKIRGFPGNAGALTSCHGRGGYTVAQLAQGTLHYNNLLMAVQSSFDECVSLGYAYKVPFVDWIHGEANVLGSSGAYYTEMITQQDDYDTDIKLINSQTETVQVLLDQISNWTSYNVATSFVPFDQLQLALDFPDKFKCAGPKYHLQTVEDGTHLPASSTVRLGAQHARPAQAIIAGNQWLPTHCISASLSGSEITLEFHTPYGALTIDTTNVTNPGNFGIRFIDSTTSATVSSVKLIGNNKVKVTLSNAPTGTGKQIGIADIGISGNGGGPLTGPRSNFRDSCTDLDATGLPVYNWACHQRINVI